MATTKQILTAAKLQRRAAATSVVATSAIKDFSKAEIEAVNTLALSMGGVKRSRKSKKTTSKDDRVPVRKALGKSPLSTSKSGNGAHDTSARPAFPSAKRRIDTSKEE